jgi:hypothetical protein
MMFSSDNPIDLSLTMTLQRHRSEINACRSFVVVSCYTHRIQIAWWLYPYSFSHSRWLVSTTIDSNDTCYWLCDRCVHRTIIFARWSTFNGIVHCRSIHFFCSIINPFYAWESTVFISTRNNSFVCMLLLFELFSLLVISRLPPPVISLSVSVSLAWLPFLAFYRSTSANMIWLR